MRRTLHFLLLLGAMFGLFGLQVASAAVPHAPVAAPAMAAVDADCMEMMRKAPQPAQMPCKGLTLDCIAAMGCVVPVMMRVSEAAVLKPLRAPVLAFWPTVPVLAGSDPPPEQHPPTLLG